MITEQSASRLREVAAKIPEGRLDMGWWMHQDSECGTVGCLLGWAAHFQGLEVDSPYGGFALVLENRETGVPVLDWAEKYFGLSREQVISIALASRWPDDLHDKYYQKRIMRNAALRDVIERFIACGGDWDNEVRPVSQD